MMKWFMTLAEATAIAAEATPAPSDVPANALVDLPLFTKGLLTTGMGLLGVFLVLTLFFVTIKLMQKIGAKDAQ